MREHPMDRQPDADFAGPFLVAPDGPTGPAAAAAAAAAQERTIPPKPDGSAARSEVTGFHVTGRGAIVAMFGLFLFGGVVANWLNLAVLTGITYVAGCVLAPLFVGRRALLKVVIAPPAVFLVAVIVMQVMTAQGTSRHGKALSVLEGTLLTLAAVAGWLFGGTALGIIVACTRGLRASVREFSADLRGGISEEDLAVQAARLRAAQQVRQSRPG